MQCYFDGFDWLSFECFFFLELLNRVSQLKRNVMLGFMVSCYSSVIVIYLW